MNGVRYCQYDGTHIITDQSRLRRGARYCSPECDHAAALERRNARAKRVCRLCGRNATRLADERKVRRQLAQAMTSFMEAWPMYSLQWQEARFAVEQALALSASLDSAAARKVRQSTTNDSEACAAQAQEA